LSSQVFYRHVIPDKITFGLFFEGRKVFGGVGGDALFNRFPFRIAGEFLDVGQ